MKATVIPKLPPNPVQDLEITSVHKVATKIIVSDDKYTPQYNAAADCVQLVAKTDSPVVLPHRAIAKVGCGIQIELPAGYKAEVTARPEWASRGLLMADAPAVFAGGQLVEISVQLINCGREIITINDGDHFALMTVKPAYSFEWITDV